MADTVTINGVSHQIAVTGDENWGTYMHDTINACAQALQRSGGSFTLTAEIDFGSTYGLKAPYLKTDTGTPANAGKIRFANSDSLNWRRSDGNADLPLNVVSDQLTYNGNSIITASGTLTASNAVVTDATGSLITHPNVTLEEVNYLNGVTSPIQTQLDNRATAPATADRDIVSNSAGGDIIVQDWPRLYPSDRQLVSSDLPNTTTVYGWNFDGSQVNQNDPTTFNFVGSTELFVRGSNLTTATDVLGNTNACNFNGSVHLNSTDGVFQLSTGNEDLTIAFWAYRDSWAAVNEALLARIDSSAQNGWRLYCYSDGYMYWQTYSSASETSRVNFNYTNLSSGWHHFVLTRDGDADTSLFVDGLLVAKVSDANQIITNGGDFEIGARNGGNKWNGRLDEVLYHLGTEYTVNDVAKLYCRSSRRIAKEVPIAGNASNTQIEFVSPMEGQRIPYYPYFADNITPNAFNDIGAGAGGFDSRVAGYRVWKNKVYYEGFAQCHATPPTAINTQLRQSLPLPAENSGQGAIPEYSTKFYDSSGSVYYRCEIDISSDSLYWNLTRVDATYGYRVGLIDTRPVTWAENDGPAWSFIYTTADNKS